MAAKMKFTPQSLESAREILKGRKQTVIGNNTNLVDGEDGNVYAEYHGNRIVMYTEDGLHATWAGWGTSTTTTRLNQLTPARFNIKQGEGYIDGEETSLRAWVKVS